jgi:predicted aspartyl protease
MHKVTYNNSLPCQLKRPHAAVQLVNGVHQTMFAFGNCLVDTGADHTILPAAAAGVVDIALPSTTTAFATLGGVVKVYQVPNCTIKIEGTLVRGVTVLFDPSGRVPPVVGRDVLMELKNFGLNQVEWLWE